MTKFRRLLSVAALLAVVAGITSSFLWGDNQLKKRNLLPKDKVLADPLQQALKEAQLAKSKLEKSEFLVYDTLKGDSLFAIQVKPTLPKADRKPRDLVFLVSASADQAGAYWNASRQMVKEMIKTAGPEDRVSVWTVSSPDKDGTRNFTDGFLSPKEDAKKIETALEQMDTFLPAGDADLAFATKKAIDSFGPKGRQRSIIYFGSGMSVNNPIKQEERNELSKSMVSRKVTFFSVPLGKKFSSENVHGLPTNTGGAVIRVSIFKETVEDAAKRTENYLSAPVFYPRATGLKLSDTVTNVYPSQLPPMRPDTPTLVVGRMKKAKQVSLTIEGQVDGNLHTFKKTLDVPAHDPNHFFLVSTIRQWRNAPTEPAMIRGDRALVFAFESNRLKRDEWLTAANLARQQRNLKAMEMFYKGVQQLDPQNKVAKGGLQLALNIKTGKTTFAKLEEQLKKAFADRTGVKIAKIDGKIKLTDEIIKVAQAQVNQPNPVNPPLPNPLGKGADAMLKKQEDLALIQEQKVKESVTYSIRQARKILKDDPTTAHQILRDSLLQIQSNIDLRQGVRESLLNSIEVALRDVTQRGKAIMDRNAEEARIASETLKNLNRKNQLKVEEDRLEAQYNVFRSLMNKARYEELAMQEIMAGMLKMEREAKIKGMDPPPQTEMLRFTAQARHNIQRWDDLKRLREDRFLQIMMDVEETHVPFPDEPPIHFPPLKTWDAIRKIRKDKYEVSSLPDDYKARIEAKELAKLLELPLATKDFQNLEMSLEEFLLLLYEKIGAKTNNEKEFSILIDTEAFISAEPDRFPDAQAVYESKVKFPRVLPPNVVVVNLLKIALGSLDSPTTSATYLIRRDFLEITTSERAVADRVLRVYPVGQLVIPVSQGGMGGFNIGGGGFGQFQGGGGFNFGGGGFGQFQGGGGFNFGGQFGGGGFNFGGGGGFNFGGGGFGQQFGGGGFNFGGGGFGQQFGGGGFNFGGQFGGGGFNFGGGGFNFGGGGFNFGGQFGGQFGGGNFSFGGGQAGGFNGSLGFQGASQAPSLIQLITTVVAPGEWYFTQAQQSFNQTQGGFAGFQVQGGFAGFGFAGNFNGGFNFNNGGFNFNNGGFNFNNGGFNFNPGNINPGNINPGNFQPGTNFNGPPLPPSQGGIADARNSNSIDFYQPALALVIRGTSQIRYKRTGGVFGGKKDEVPGPQIGVNDPKFVKAGDPLRKGKILGDRGKFDPKKGKVAANKGKFVPEKQEDLNPEEIWQKALEEGNPNPGIVIAASDFLFEHKKYDHAAELLKASVRQGIIVRPWVYEALAIAMEMSQTGTPEEIRRVRMSALALNPDDPTGYMEAAEVLAEYKDLDRAISLCRQASLLEPNWVMPYERALNYAFKNKDTQAMEWAAGHILSQEWTVDNRELHLKAEAKLNALSAYLQRKGEQAKADRLQDVLRNAQQRDMIVRISWEKGLSGPADFELMVKEPNGSVASSLQRATPGGGILTGNTLEHQTDASYVASKAFSGDYEITIKRLWGQPLNSEVMLEIIRHDGTEVKHLQRLPIRMEKDEHKLTVKLDKGRRTQVARITPVLPQKTVKQVERRSSSSGVLDKLRSASDPYSRGSITDEGFQGGFADSVASRYRQQTGKTPPPNLGKKTPSGQVIFQGGVSNSGTGVNLTTTASIVNGDLLLDVIPTFQNNSGDLIPNVDMPLIPGGRS